MLEKCRNAEERWGGVSELIDNWLGSRKTLIKSFVTLPDQTVDDELHDCIRTFCQNLMDYLSSGHFEIYEKLLQEGSDFNDGSVEEAQKLFPKIQVSTDAALDFNDQFADKLTWTIRDIRTLSESLSNLGEQLENRFSIEDTMIEVLHTSHKPLLNMEGSSQTAQV